ncbi:MAG: hypothetical protein ISR73_05285 [Gammaproteobacteria bacterium]|nr:hypothetical protein [Gammaproteobacteria bacterium]
MIENGSPSLKYTQRLWGNILDWYNNADTKAQILLTLSGVFLSFLTSAAFTKKSDLKPIVDLFGIETWVLLSLMTAFLIATIISALLCLRSSLEDPEEIDKHLHDIVVDIEGKNRQWPETMWFFGMIAQLKDRKRFQARLHEFTEEDELQALSSQIFIVSKNVLKKHKLVNRGFLFITLTLLAFLASSVSYVARVKLAPIVIQDNIVNTVQVTPKPQKPNK